MFQEARLQPTAHLAPKHVFASTETHDVDAHGRQISGWRGSYEQVGRHAFRGEVTEVRLWPFQIIYERIDQPCKWRGSAWPGARVFVSIVESQGKVSAAGREVTPRAVAVLPCDFADHSFNSAAIGTYTVAVEEAALLEYAERHLRRPLQTLARERGLSIVDAEIVEAYQHCVASVLGELRSNPHSLDEEDFRETMRRRVLGMLVDVLEAGGREAAPMSPPTTRSYVVGKAIRYMDNHLADPLEMSDFCQTIRVCPRTLRHSFQEVVGVSPTEYFLAMRLLRARRALLAGGAASNVQCVAARYGFSHLGRFAQFYADTFGERPSDTLRRSTASPSLGFGC